MRRLLKIMCAIIAIICAIPAESEAGLLSRLFSRRQPARGVSMPSLRSDCSSCRAHGVDPKTGYRIQAK